MGLHKLSNERDRTMIVRSATPTPPMLRLFLCGHKSSTTGAKLRGTLAMLCATCNQKGKP
jgi:hypothetical protein